MDSRQYAPRKQLQKKRFSVVLLLALFILWINNIPFLPGEDAGKQLATVGLIGCALLLLLVFRLSLNLEGVMPWLLFIYLAYMIAVNFVGIFTWPAPIFRDFAEPVRIAGLLFFYLLGAGCSSQIDSRDLRLFLYLYFAVTCALIISWFFSNPLVLLFSDFYITRGGRFSHTMTSVNYVWVSTLPVVWVGLILLYKRKYLASVPLILTVLVLSIFSLVLSGSRSAIGGSVAAVFVLLYWFFRNTRMRGLVVLLLSVVLLATFFLVVFDSGLVERSTNRMIDLFSLFQTRNPADVPALAVRITHWQSTWPTITDRFIFGHGSGRGGISIFDNTYLMTLYRYGAVGLALEVLIYIGIFLRATSLFNYHAGAPLVLAFLVALLLNGITSTPMYELKTPYILVFLVGWLCATSSEEIHKGKMPLSR